MADSLTAQLMRITCNAGNLSLTTFGKINKRRRDRLPTSSMECMIHVVARVRHNGAAFAFTFFFPCIYKFVCIKPTRRFNRKAQKKSVRQHVRHPFPFSLGKETNLGEQLIFPTLILVIFAILTITELSVLATELSLCPRLIR